MRSDRSQESETRNPQYHLTDHDEDWWEQDRLFQDAVHDRVQALPGRYRGSRHPVARYIYRETTMGNFIELKSEQPPMTPAEFFELLSAVPGVLAVQLEQKSLGRHYKQCTLFVYSQADPTHGMEFGLDTHSHEKPSSTISAVYKLQGNRSRAMEAWRILKHSVAGRELNAGVVEIIDTELRKLAGESDFTATRRSSSPMGHGAARLDLRQLFGPGGGPPCKVCHQQPSVCDSDAYGLVCYRCVQDDDNMCCKCNQCDPNWLRRGWVCHKGRLAKQLPFMLLRNTAAP